MSFVKITLIVDLPGGSVGELAQFSCFCCAFVAIDYL